MHFHVQHCVGDEVMTHFAGVARVYLRSFPDDPAGLEMMQQQEEGEAGKEEPDSTAVSAAIEFFDRSCGFHDRAACEWLLCFRSGSSSASKNLEEGEENETLGGGLVAMCAFVPYRGVGGASLFVFNLCTDPPLRALGLGTRLLRIVQCMALERGVLCISGSVSAVAARNLGFYSRLGARVDRSGFSAGAAGAGEATELRLRAPFSPEELEADLAAKFPGCRSTAAADLMAPFAATRRARVPAAVWAAAGFLLLLWARARFCGEENRRG
jgi:GNAT superfamily N-acetyltransferase